MIVGVIVYIVRVRDRVRVRVRVRDRVRVSICTHLGLNSVHCIWTIAKSLRCADQATAFGRA